MVQYATILQYTTVPLWGREQNKDWLIFPLFSLCMILRKMSTSKFGKHKCQAFAKSSQDVNNMKEENSLLLFVPVTIYHDLHNVYVIVFCLSLCSCRFLCLCLWTRILQAMFIFTCFPCSSSNLLIEGTHPLLLFVEDLCTEIGWEQEIVWKDLKRGRRLGLISETIPTVMEVSP